MGVSFLALLASFRPVSLPPPKPKIKPLSLPLLVVDVAIVEPEAVISEKIFLAPERLSFSL